MQVRAFHLQIVGISFGWPKHTVRWRTQSFGSAFAGQGPTGRGRASAATQRTLPLYRISTTRSPLRRACSMRGHSRSKASSKALVRQLPRRTHSKRAALSVRLAR